MINIKTRDQSLKEITETCVGSTSVIILQARTGSTRLPSKVLRHIQGIPVLSHCIERLKSICRGVSVVVATTELKRDDVIVELAESHDALCFRGPEADVLDRYYNAAKKYGAQYIIRATADNPFIDVTEARRVLDEIETGKWDYVSMLEDVSGNKLPSGVGLEAFTFSSLERSWREGKEPHHREHVNEYILENHNKFKTRLIPCIKKSSCRELRLTIDTEEDMEFIRAMLEEINMPALKLSTQEIIEWWQKKRN